MTRRLFVPLALALLAPLGVAHADSCTPSRLLLVLDKSSSMTDVLPNTQTSKWRAAQMAASQLGADYQAKIDLGLMVFPNPSQCAPGKVLIEPGPNAAAAINTALQGDPPASGNWTPMSQSIDVAAADAKLQDLARKPSILLITDGWQWCYPYDGSTRFAPVDSVTKARAKGINVYVVGFGSEVDVLTLNKMAHASGTELQGCNPTGDQLTSPKKCYYQVDNLPQLKAALDAVAVKVSAEICDGLDNDCNGLVDEGLVRGCATKCGAGMEQCMNGAWIGCDAPQPQAEICDGKDNDCDGTADEGCDCVANQTRPCGVDKGQCKPGLQTCDQSGHWAKGCVGAVGPSLEICDGIDNDCNGTVDDPSPSLCPMGSTCTDGKCQEDPLRMPDMGPTVGPSGEAGEPPTGCGCTLGGRAPNLTSLLLALGVAWALSRLLRRRA